MADSEQYDGLSLADRIRDYRATVRKQIPDQDHLASCLEAREVADDLDAILEANGEPRTNDYEVLVEYRQQFTVQAPDLNEEGNLSPDDHRRAVEDWFWNSYQDIVPEVIEPYREPHLKDHVTVLAVRPRGDD